MNEKQDTMREILIQKCADGELTEQQCIELLQSLEESGNSAAWRTLALTFVENQVLAQALAVPDEPEAMPEPQIPRGRPWYRRSLGPLTSVAAALCVGVLSGTMGHYWLGVDGGAATRQVADDGSPADHVHRQVAAVSNHAGDTAVPSGRLKPNPAPVMNVSLNPTANPNQSPVNVPVYSPENWGAIPNALPSAVVPEEIQKLLDEQGLTLERQRSWYRARLKDGREVLVPTETVRVRPSVQ